ncbi:type III-B CRISPR module-associated protein Cmr3 [Methylomarinum sp. Ch1-1]|uniref:Type III-B CRISPR module-associated protein Cmr3 n=1 Tax=Methylomarinum roseum TaxID=3067653 RepID=A0AAU7P0V7_9GAMM|nr:type III-B CRISPR module-associated protein Cmr3 [Methylomarinum sp. Ch1-1]MDP4521426.1 type III-B CRISPR module-associated protein Cmr3 [Methylomarinum sp. Ch1-1]
MAKPHKKNNYRKQQRQQQKRAQAVQVNAELINAEGRVTLQLHALDTWFFRESRPHDAVGASELASLFPPPVRTLAGALRTFIGERIGINWQNLSHQLSGLDFTASLGGSEGLGQLQLQGPWIVYKNQRLYPAPLYLMQGSLDGKPDLQRLQAGQTVRCDLGHVRLPELPAGRKGYKALEQRWLTPSGLAQCLNGKTPESQHIIAPEQLFSHEPRLGIARNNASRSVIDGKLYQTRHLRVQDQVHIELDVQGLPQELLPFLDTRQPALMRLGGEGRMASISMSPTIDTLPFARVKTVNSVLLHFITPADFGGNWYPEDFVQTDINGQTVWRGQINGIEINIEAAVIGKVHREGGWDMKNHQPRPVKSYIPAGSAWFCRLGQDYDWQTLTDKLHGHCIGYDTAFGRGQILLGHWRDSINA